MKKKIVIAVVIFITAALIATFFLKGIMDSVTVTAAPATAEQKAATAPKAFALASGINSVA